MKKLITAIFAGALLATTPVWAKGGHGHGHGHDKHAAKEWHKAQKHWAKHHRHGHDHVVVHQYVQAGPAVVHRHVVHERVVVAPPAPPPGVHIALPNIYIPF